jgi:predicted enzyme related to lactoylglutathione lyase
MRIYGVRVFVDDINEARKFYGQTLGLTEKWSFGPAAGYDLGADLIIDAVTPDDDEEEGGLVGRFVGVSIQVEAIHAVYADWTAKGVEFLGPPEKMPWGGVLAHFKDPSGNVLSLLGEN